MTVARVQQLLDWAAEAEGRRRVHLLAEAGEILRTLPFADPEVEAATHRRAKIVLRFTDIRANGTPLE